jgi:hypothetical protein
MSRDAALSGQMCRDDWTTEILAQRGGPTREVIERCLARNERLEQTLARLNADLVSLITKSDESRKLCYLGHDRARR